MVDYDLTETQLREGYRRCIENVQNLLDSAKLLLKSECSQQFALGLYMHAIEEYGKAEILRTYILENKSRYSIPEWIFGKGDLKSKAHNRKLSEGLKKIPPICRRLSRIIEITDNASKAVRIFEVKKNGITIGSIMVPAHLSGTFEDPFIPKQTVDFDLKTACFYIDWDYTDGNWKFILPPDKEQLVYNIERMKKQLLTTKAKEDNIS
jgi:AbiV family abortive infection protein